MPGSVDQSNDRPASLTLSRWSDRERNWLARCVAKPSGLRAASSSGPALARELGSPKASKNPVIAAATESARVCLKSTSVTSSR
jgi:hypothetical protein